MSREPSKIHQDPDMLSLKRNRETTMRSPRQNDANADCRRGRGVLPLEQTVDLGPLTLWFERRF